MTTPFKVTFSIIDEKKIYKSEEELKSLIRDNLTGLMSIEKVKSRGNLSYDCEVVLMHPTDHSDMIKFLKQKGLGFKEN